MVFCVKQQRKTPVFVQGTQIRALNANAKTFLNHARGINIFKWNHCSRVLTFTAPPYFSTV